jgi:hypothetical protein
MRDRNTDLWKPRNPLTQQSHRREVLWQITIPVVVGTVLMLALCVLATMLSAPSASLWADISIIWMIPPVFLVAFLMMAINAGSAYLLIRVIAAAPPFFFKAQNFFRRVQLKVGAITNKAVEPFLRLQAWGASARAAKREAQRVIDKTQLRR